MVEAAFSVLWGLVFVKLAPLLAPPLAPYIVPAIGAVTCARYWRRYRIARLHFVTAPVASIDHCTCTCAEQTAPITRPQMKPVAHTHMEPVESMDIIAEVASTQIGQMPEGANTAIVSAENSQIVSREDFLPAPEQLSPKQVASVWIDHLQRGRHLPDRQTLIQLLKALVGPRIPLPISETSSTVDRAAARADMDVSLIFVDTGRKFPHIKDTENGKLSMEEAVYTQCKTHMTHVAVRLVDSSGKPVAGTRVQEEGLVLRLSLHKVSNPEEALDDDDNPRPSEGLFRGRAGGIFNPEVVVQEARHEYKLQVMLLSSDIGGERMFFKIAPTDPDLARNKNLVINSRSFISRARMPDTLLGSADNRKNAATQLLKLNESVTIVGSRVTNRAKRAFVEEDDTDAMSHNKRHCTTETGETSAQFEHFAPSSIMTYATHTQDDAQYASGYAR